MEDASSTWGANSRARQTKTKGPLFWERGKGEAPFAQKVTIAVPWPLKSGPKFMLAAPFWPQILRNFVVAAPFWHTLRPPRWKFALAAPSPPPRCDRIGDTGHKAFTIVHGVWKTHPIPGDQIPELGNHRFLNTQSTGVVDQEFIVKTTEHRRFILFALCDTWEALGGWKILHGAGNNLPTYLEVLKQNTQTHTYVVANMFSRGVCFRNCLFLLSLDKHATGKMTIPAMRQSRFCLWTKWTWPCVLPTQIIFLRTARCPCWLFPDLIPFEWAVFVCFSCNIFYELCVLSVWLPLAPFGGSVGSLGPSFASGICHWASGICHWEPGICPCKWWHKCCSYPPFHTRRASGWCELHKLPQITCYHINGKGGGWVGVKNWE